jgi:hypothetical protein
VALVAQVIGQLDLERSLDQPLRQLRQQPARSDDLLLGLRSGQQLVNHLVGQLPTDLVRHRFKNLRRGRRRLA